MKTKSALFISAFNKQNKLRELLSDARLPTKKKKGSSEATISLQERSTERLGVSREQRQGDITYGHVIYSQRHDYTRFHTSLQLAGITIKIIV